MSNFIQEKQPNEVIPSSIDFRKRIPVGETLDAANCDVIAATEDGVDKTTDLIVAKAISGTVISAVIKDGVSGQSYYVTFKAKTTPTGYKFEGEVLLKVQEHPNA